MRGSKLQGRFNMDYESKSIYEGITEDLGDPVGQEVDWFQWSPEYFRQNYSAIVDDIYDVSNAAIVGGVGEGRRWASPINVPTVMAQIIRSTNVMNERGFYVSNTLRLVLNVGEVERLIPSMLKDPSAHIKDRVVYLGSVYTPTRVLPRGSFGTRWAVVTIDFNQVNPEELINDPQFNMYALDAGPDIRSKVADLAAIKVNKVAVPSFDPNDLTYSKTISVGTTSVSISALAKDGTNSTILINGVSVESGASKSVATPTSTTTVTIACTSNDASVTKTYVLTLTKA